VDDATLVRPSDAGEAPSHTVAAPPDQTSRLFRSSPRTVAGYVLLEQIGRGGMGVVYKARQEGLNRIVAIKTILAGADAGDDDLERFRAEAEAVARLRHENIVQIYQVGTLDEGGTRVPFMALEYIDGGGLDKQIAGTPWAPRKAAELIETLARAIHSAHQAEIVHRDLKPANVLLTASGTPKVTDFGLAKRLDADAGRTRSGSILGTPSYMAPEQARGDIGAIGPATDVYALGAILYELLTGRAPFKSPTVWDTVQQVIEQPPVPPTQFQGNAPRDLETICLKCLAKEPAHRYPSAAALADDVRLFLDGKAIHARPAGGMEKAWRWCRRNPWLASTAAAAVIALISGTAISSYFAVRAGDNARMAADKAQQAEANAAVADANARQAEANAAAADENARRANRLAAYAARQRDLSLESFNTLLTEVQERLADTPAMRQIRDRLVETAVRGLDRLAEAGPVDVGADRGLADARLRLAQSFERLGNSGAARKEYEAALAAFDAIARAQPGDLGATVLVAAVRSDLSGLIAVSDPAAARSHARAAAAALGPRPGSPAARAVLATVCLRLGRFLQEDGDRVGAERELRRGLTLREELSASTPDDVGRRLAVLEAFQAIGELLTEPDVKAAGELFAKAEKIATELEKAHPTDRRVKVRVAALVLSYGIAAERAGSNVLASLLYVRAYRLQREVLTDEPFNVGVQFASVRSCQRLAELNFRTDDKELARDYAVTGVIRLGGVLAADPTNPVYLRVARDLEWKLADMSQKWSAWIGTRNHQRRALALTRQLAAADPKNEALHADEKRLQQQLAETETKVGKGTSSNSIGIDLVRVPAGTFRMGADEEVEAAVAAFKEPKGLFLPEHPARDVTISKELLFGATEVTRGQFRAFVDATGYRTDAEKDGRGVGDFNPAFGSQGRRLDDWRGAGFTGLSDDQPVIGVSWNDANAFCEWLSKKEGRKYRLPSEAEWEYACRAGTKTRFWTGNDPESLAIGANVPDKSYREANLNTGYATLEARDGYAGIAPVGEFAANPFGLYDMHGNVWEWCQDGYDPKAYEQLGKEDPREPDRPMHVTRGGCYV
jgi:formylglycine-generating enzyme required for sulfatase activity/tRNA A-37 threonylcarbamoyl transferase component Bud32